ncbi:MAG: ribosomal RNA small subunit methyltransferase A [bacterium]|nr:ribosomal RNA small subunit methyltransferase A [bacterium]
MNDYPLSNKHFLINYLKQHNIRLRKRYGQNFAVDKKLFETILAAADISPDDTIIEIGPGIGSLTEWLVSSGATVFAVEIDSALHPLLEHHFANCSRFMLIKGDILHSATLNTIENVFKNHSGKRKAIANLPYYITSPILIHLLQGTLKYNRIVVTMQKEVADRITAKTGTKQYSALTIFTQYYARCTLCGTFPPSSFFPSPQVSSSVVLIEPYDVLPMISKNADFFHSFVKLCFTQRRKMIKNSVSALFSKWKLSIDLQKRDAILLQHDISPDVRPECLSSETFINLANSLWEIMPQTLQHSFLRNEKGE